MCSIDRVPNTVESHGKILSRKETNLSLDCSSCHVREESNGDRLETWKCVRGCGDTNKHERHTFELGNYLVNNNQVVNSGHGEAVEREGIKEQDLVIDCTVMGRGNRQPGSLQIRSSGGA